MTIADSNYDAIVDGGATGTVTGLRQYHDLCEELDLMPNIMKASSRDPQSHSFGTSGNSSNREQVVDNARIPIPCRKGCLAEIETFVIDGNVPFIIAKPTMRILRGVENHAEDYLEIAMGDSQGVRTTTYMGLMDILVYLWKGLKWI